MKKTLKIAAIYMNSLTSYASYYDKPMSTQNHVGYMGQTRGSLLWVNLMIGQGRGLFSWVKLKRQIRGSILQVNLVDPSSGSNLWIKYVGHFRFARETFNYFVV